VIKIAKDMTMTKCMTYDNTDQTVDEGKIFTRRKLFAVVSTKRGQVYRPTHQVSTTVNT